MVAVNGGATFSNVPAGTYTDIVTGKTYNGGGSITVDAPKNQGQLRVLVKGWTGGKVGEDGKFIYTTSPVNHGGSVSFKDPGTTQYYTANDVVKDPNVTLTPGSSSFKTETLTVTATLSEEAASGWYKIGNQAQVNISKGQSKTFTVGGDLKYGESVTVSWGAKDASGKEFTGNATYKKVDPNAVITIYVSAPSAPNMYAWGNDASGNNVEPCGKWPGKKLTDSTEINGKTFYYCTIDDLESVNVIFNNGAGGDGNQTSDISGITSDTFFEYNGSNQATKLENFDVTPVPSVSFSPNGGSFEGTVTVNVSARNATSAWYKIGNGAQKNFTSTASFTLGEGMADGESVTVSWSATNGKETKTGNVTFTKEAKPAGYVAYFDNSKSNWGKVYAYAWTGGDQHFGAWPGQEITKTQVINGKTYYVIYLPVKDDNTMIIFNNGNGGNGNQTGDFKFVEGGVYDTTGQNGVISGVENILDADDAEVEFYNLQGVRVLDPAPGIYIRRQGRNVTKVVIR